MQIEVAVEPAEDGRSPIRDPTRNPAGDPVGGHSGDLTEGTQLRPQLNKNLTGNAQLQPQQNLDTMKVDKLEVPDLRIVEVVADPTTANKADNLSDFNSDSEMRAHVAYLKKKKKC